LGVEKWKEDCGKNSVLPRLWDPAEKDRKGCGEKTPVKSGGAGVFHNEKRLLLSLLKK
jgi:hypothetical protein